MDTENIIQSAEILVQQIADYPQEVLAMLSADERIHLLEGLDDLSNRILAVRTRGDLAKIADEILCLIESQSALHPLFFGTQRDLATAQQQRKISIADHESTAKLDSHAQLHAIQVRNAILECREQLQRALSEPQTHE